MLSSVCIDIGSAGTQILFSRMHLRRQAVDLSTRYLVILRETLYESPVSLTPYRGERMLNIDVGGGTTKLSVIDKGKVLSTAAIHIGSRLVAVDGGGRPSPRGAASPAFPA